MPFAHLFCLIATLCRTFTWRNALIGYLVYAIPGIFGITLCYHRMLTHRSFKTYKYDLEDCHLHHAVLEHNVMQQFKQAA
jgi:fatty-acid desaturase